MKKFFGLAFILCLSIQFGFSQISSVNYNLKYNIETCLYDVYMVVNEGSASKVKERAQFNAQVTVVAPLASKVKIVKSYMPLLNNQGMKSVTPSSWSISNEVESPENLENSQLVSILPELLPNAFYNELNSGDEVKLFSLEVTNVSNCGRDVRLFDNENDPVPFSKGMYGANFKNGFTIGGVEQKYARNSAALYPAGPIIEDVRFSMKNGVKLDINALPSSIGSCQRSLSFDVALPNGDVVDYRTFISTDSKDIQRGTHKVIVKDDLGCATEAEFNPYNSSTSEESAFANEEDVLVQFESGIFPNPAQNEFTITLSGTAGTEVKGEITDLEGKVVKRNVVNTTMAQGTDKISVVSDFLPGMYNLSLTVNNNKKVNHKILIIK